MRSWNQYIENIKFAIRKTINSFAVQNYEADYYFLPNHYLLWRFELLDVWPDDREKCYQVSSAKLIGK
jgi:hypothetical protein